jgi:hypothetical protein
VQILINPIVGEMGIVPGRARQCLIGIKLRENDPISS